MELFNIIGDETFLIFYPFYSIALIVITLLTIELIDFWSIFKKFELKITDYELMFFYDKFTFNSVVIYCLLTLYIHRYIKIKKDVISSSQMVVDTNSFKDSLLCAIFNKINSRDYTIKEIFKDTEIKRIFNDISNNIKKDFITKSFFKTSNYKYSFVILIPIIVPGLSKIFSNCNIYILLLEILLILLIFSWVLHSYTIGPTRYGRHIFKKHKKSLKKDIKAANNDFNNELILSYYARNGIKSLTKIPEMAIFYKEFKNYE